MASPFFSNQPLFCQKPVTIEGLFNIEQFNALTAANLACTAQENGCLDPNIGTTFVKNVVNKVIRCGGRNIEIDFFMKMFPETPMNTETKTVYNHYVCDADLNVYAAANVTGSGPGVAATFQLLKANHAAAGSESLPATDYVLMDKDNQIMYSITDVDTTIPYAHKVEITPMDSSVTVSIKANTPYLILQTRMVGGYSCPVATNKAMTIGYSKQIKPLRLRSDWNVAINLLRGYNDKIQYAVIYDRDGKPYDAWDVYEAQQARENLRIGLNVLSMIGTPITNTALISGGSSIVDAEHTGYYGLIPSIANGGGIVQNYNAALGFDLEADGEPIFLYQDSLKRSNKFLFLCGQKFLFGLDNRANKMVPRTQQTSTPFEAFKRFGDWLTPEDIHGGKSYTSEVAKIGIREYDYRGFEFAFKKWDGLSDKRFFGTDYYSDMVVGLPMEGPKTGDGTPVSPVQFYQYGWNGWTGGYEEFRTDHRVIDGCENLTGYSAQSMAMAVHCPQLFILLRPAKAS